MRWWARGATLVAVLLLAGCSSEQAAFAPAGLEAQRINALFWGMTIGGAVIFVGVLIAAGLAIFGPQGLRDRLKATGFVVGAGIAFPVAVLTALFVFGVLLLGAGATSAPQDGIRRIAISGEQWWWRVSYFDEAGNRIDSANELHVPVGEPVRLELMSPDVIHSFWAPRLAGKLDMIPGRTNVLTVTATEPSISRGQCAEFCGAAHALMSFHVIAEAKEAYEAWLAHEASDAVPPAGDAERRGAALFQSAGCGGCHTVRGTAARGSIGPDLTHVGSRRSLAAATLPNDAEAFARWIVANQHIKPENRMPAYEIFSEAQLEDLALYLEGLK